MYTPYQKKSKEVKFAYRCRSCSVVFYPLGGSDLDAEESILNAFRGTPQNSQSPTMCRTHKCEDSHYGICDLIGYRVTPECALKVEEEEEEEDADGSDDPYDCGPEPEESAPVKNVYDAPDFHVYQCRCWTKPVFEESQVEAKDRRPLKSSASSRP